MGHRSGDGLRRALASVATHPAVYSIGSPSSDHNSGVTSVDVTFDVSLPSEWRRCGHSPSGVRSREIVRFEFPAGFPLKAPSPLLRPDFNRNLPHMQPWLTEGRPVPCVHDGDLAELILRDGLAGFVNQTAVWLERAALGTLIDPDQGWEPVLRDSYPDHLIADGDGLGGLVTGNGGYKFLRLDYLRTAVNGQVHFVHGQVSAATADVTPAGMFSVFAEGPVHPSLQFSAGKSVALVVWPGKQPSGTPIVADTYLPEAVTSVEGLKERAETYGCRASLSNALHWMEQCLRTHPPEGPFCLAVILLARRPYNVIGTQSPIELCPYVLDIVSPGLYINGDKTSVRPAGHRHAVSRSLLAQLSGIDSVREHPCWTLIGAGSLGSKLALHLARAGNGPAVVVDKSAMTPHNAARHALIPTTGDMHILWMAAKATLLCDSLRGLDHIANPVPSDATSILTSTKSTRAICPKGSWAIVNATASVAVREALASSKEVATRVIETSLFSSGQVGVVTAEGPHRNPNTNDLIAECYALLAEDSTLSRIVFGPDNGIRPQSVGQGCSSLTMPMSDGRLSLFAAGMAEYLLRRQRDGLPPEAGEVLIGALSCDGLGLRWQVATALPVIQTQCKAESGTWDVHIHQRAASKIRTEVERWPSAETGGVLIGRLSEVSRTVHVVDVLPAPKDSQRSASSFVLGTIGLRQHIENYSKAAGWSLYCLGTWHSHLSTGGPSPTDEATTRAVAIARVAPSVALIHTPAGYCAFLAEPESVLRGRK